MLRNARIAFDVLLNICKWPTVNDYGFNVTWGFPGVIYLFIVVFVVLACKCHVMVSTGECPDTWAEFGLCNYHILCSSYDFVPNFSVYVC